MNAFENGPLGPWDHLFTFVEDIGCLPALIGFVLFVVAITVVWQVLF